MATRELNPTLIDVFCGAGGLTLGFTKAFGHSFQPIWALDSDKSAVATYNRNFGVHCVLADITETSILNRPVPTAQIVIGGPPCQGFSQLNRSRQSDPRRRLWRQFLEVVDAADAEVFVMENVPQFLKSDEFRKLRQKARQLGFRTTASVLCAADYGVPQKRYRAITVGSRIADPSQFFPPAPTHYDPKTSKLDVQRAFGTNREIKLNPWSTVKDALGDLEPPVGTDIRPESSPYDLHFGRRPTDVSLRRYRAIPKEGMNRFDLMQRLPDLTPACWKKKESGGTDLFGRLWWDRPSCTIRTEFFKPEKGRYLHPAQHRPITHREAARLQGFPDTFVFVGSKTEIARQIGNAVPPPLAARLADCVFEMIKSRKR